MVNLHLLFLSSLWVPPCSVFFLKLIVFVRVLGVLGLVHDRCCCRRWTIPFKGLACRLRGNKMQGYFSPWRTPPQPARCRSSFPWPSKKDRLRLGQWWWRVALWLLPGSRGVRVEPKVDCSFLGYFPHKTCDWVSLSTLTLGYFNVIYESWRCPQKLGEGRGKQLSYARSTPRQRVFIFQRCGDGKRYKAG